MQHTWKRRGMHTAFWWRKKEGKRPLGTHRCRWEGIKMDLREIGWGSMDWINMAQDRGQGWVLVNMVINLQVPWNVGKFLSN
jgi:hypothetical protein